LLGEQAVGDHVAAGAAVLRRDVRAEVALLAEAADELRRDRFLAVPAAGVGRDLGRDEGTEPGAGFPLLGRELQLHAGAASTGAPCLRATNSEMARIERKLSRSRSSSPTVTPNSFSTKATSCMASSELTKPRAKMSSSGCRSWPLKKRLRNALILSWVSSMGGRPQ